MKTTSIPNIITIIINLIFVFGFGFITFFIPIKIFKDINEGDLKDGVILPAILIFMVVGFFLLSLIIQLTTSFSIVSINENGVRIIKPILLFNKFYPYKNILGYSESEVKFGRYSWTSTSVVIYTEDNKVCELIKAYCFNFKSIKRSLEQSEIKYLGFEGYMTGWWLRDYYF